MRSWTYTLTEHEPDEPWRIVSVKRGMTIELEDGASFYEWSHQQWPSERYSVDLDPYQL